MSAWKKCRIGDLCDTISETYKRTDNMVVLINTSDVLEGEVLNHTPVPNENLKGQFKKTFQRDDILYSEIRPANKRFAFIDFEDTSKYIASTKLMVLRPRKDAVLPLFLYAILKSRDVLEELQHLAETRSGTFPQITFSSELAPMEIMLPDFTTQKQIVGILSAIEDKIRLNTAINENLEQQAQTLFKDMIADVQEQVPFTSVIQVLGGGTPKTGNQEYWNGEIPFFTPKDVGNPYVLTTEKSITPLGLDNCNSRLYPVNTVFLTARGTVGKVSLAGVQMAMNQSCYALAGKNGLHQIIVYHYVLETVKALKHKASGAVFDAIITRDFDTESVPALSSEQIKSYIAVAEPIYSEILNRTLENQRLSALRDTLLPKLMNGEIDVSAVKI